MLLPKPLYLDKMNKLHHAAHADHGIQLEEQKKPLEGET
jgi:hypothetical protein